MGVCNNEKDALTNCLQQFAHTYTKQSLADKRERQKKKKSDWQKLEDDEKILNILIQRELAKRGDTAPK